MPRFCTAVDDGQPCGTRALPGQSFCAGHSTQPSIPWRGCAFCNLRGEPCRAVPLRGQDHCFTHSPRNRRFRRPIFAIERAASPTLQVSRYPR